MSAKLLTTTVVSSEKIRAKKILDILREHHVIRDEDFASLIVARESHDLFRVLVVTVLSQSCTDVAAIRAYRNLDREIGVTVAKLGQAKLQTLEQAIRGAGLHRQKSRALRRLARVLAQEYSGDLDNMLQGPIEEVRARLEELPKVGPKTADALLGVWGRPTVSVDTHVNRVSKRLGFAAQKAKYEEVRSTLMQLFRQEDYRFLPLLLMAHGREICKARKPLCPICPVEKLCPYLYKTKRI